LPATVNDIARATGLSQPTVSRVLNKRHGHFSEATRERVLDAARELGYRPNALARATRTGRFHAVALILGTTATRHTLQRSVLNTMVGQLSERAMHLMVTKLSDQALTDPETVPRLLREQCADGLIVNYTHDAPSKMIELIEGHHLPAIWLNTKRPHDCVHHDDVAAGAHATRHLLNRGYQRIAYLDHSHSQQRLARCHHSAIDREQGYRQAMREAGREPCVIRPVEHVASGQRLPRTLELLQAADRPDALVCYSDQHAANVLIAGHMLGLRPGEALGLMCVSDGIAYCGSTPLPSVQLDNQQLGTQTVAMVIEKIAQPTKLLPPRVIQPFAADAGAAGPPPVTPVPGPSA